MDLTIKGTVEKILEEQSGEGRNGPWRKRDFILKTGGEYPKQVCITQWGDQIDQTALQEGEEIVAHIDVQSREYKGRWYTDVKAWKIEKSGDMGPVQQHPEEQSQEIDLSGVDDDLPF